MYEINVKNGSKICFTIDEYIHELFPNNTEKMQIKLGWINIRDNLLKKFRRENLKLSLSEHIDEINHLQEEVSRAEQYYYLGEKHYDNAIISSGKCCESILKILYDIYHPKELERPLELHDYMTFLKPQIIDIFGKNSYHDVDFIRDIRNNCAHSKGYVPDETTTYQIIQRMKLFYDTFMKWQRNQYLIFET